MSFNNDMVAYLDARLTTVASRIYPMVLPQEPEFPSLTYQHISAPREYSHDGAGLVNPRYQFDCWSDDHDEALAVAAELVAISKLAGPFFAQAAFIENESGHYEPETGYYRIIVEALLWHGE